jgi:hypothetical protein
MPVRRMPKEAAARWQERHLFRTVDMNDFALERHSVHPHLYPFVCKN